MKKKLLRLAMLFVVAIMVQSCVKDTLQSTQTYYVPVYKSKAEVLQNIKSAAPQALQQTGKLFVHGSYIFVNELNKGVHIIDNSNPLLPKNMSFIAIPGNIDLAVKDNTLYADLYTDMITIDITNPANTVVKKVNKNVFPERSYTNGFVPDSTQYIVDWLKKETNDQTDLNNNKSQPIMWFGTAQFYSSNTASAGDSKGVSGSMARFTIVDNYLYTVGSASLTAFNITIATNPVVTNIKSLGFNIETIYPLNNKLFIGSQTGMLIYSITDPANPTQLGSFSHACFRDPVIADNQYAYVTLRATTDPSPCRGTATAQRNELDIVDISNLLRPTLIKVFDMAEPKGLSKDGDLLFICDGKAGLKIYNAAAAFDIKLIKTIASINPMDVITMAGLAIVVADEGIYQYDYTDLNNIKLVSKITINKL